MSKRKAARKGKTYTPREKNFIRESWKRMTGAEMADELGRTVCGVRSCRAELGLRRQERAFWSKEKVVNQLKELSKKLDRPLVASDDRNLTEAAYRYFGSWNTAKEAAELETFRPRSNLLARNTVTKKGPERDIIWGPIG